MATPSFPRMHVSLYVSNIYQTADFYSKFFGQQPSKIKPDYCKFTLEEPALIISFVQNETKVSNQFGHLGLQVETEEILTSRLNDMKSKQVEVLEEMGTNCCYANQDKFWVTDPDGYMWEVYYFHEDVAFNDPRYAVQGDQACCTPEMATAETEVKAEKPRVRLSTLTAANEGSSCTPGSGCC